MEGNFWMGFFAMISSITVAILGHLKNVSQDKEGLKRDLRINTLENELKHCHEDRDEIKEELASMRARKS